VAVTPTGSVMSSDSRRLIHDASKGDQTALEGLLLQHLPALQAFVRLRMGEHLKARESCSDLVQSVCREVLQDLPAFEYRDEAGFRQWLYTRALNKIFNRARFYKAEKRDLAKELRPGGGGDTTGTAGILDVYRSFCTPSEDAVAHERMRQVEEAFARLPEDYREVITLSRVIGLSHQQIAEQMKKSEGAVRVLLHRALARLSGLLGA
jgi:RNA polymerase sigma-70 factor (ECF subfamily)